MEEVDNMADTREISNQRQISGYLHCGLCIAELLKNPEIGKGSPRDYARLEVGWTAQGLQVWCVRHDVNVLHVDFAGKRMRANTSARVKDDKPVQDK